MKVGSSAIYNVQTGVYSHTMNDTQKLVSVAEVLRALGESEHVVRKPGGVDKLIKKYKIEVVSEAPWGRGTIKFMSSEHAEGLYYKHGKKEAPESAEAGDPQLHVIALEEQIRKLEVTLKSNTDAMQMLLKQNNILCDRLLAVLKDLGAKDPAHV
jgi:hypothetical protein